MTTKQRIYFPHILWVSSQTLCPILCLGHDPTILKYSAWQESATAIKSLLWDQQTRLHIRERQRKQTVFRWRFFFFFLFHYDWDCVSCREQSAHQFYDLHVFERSAMQIKLFPFPSICLLFWKKKKKFSPCFSFSFKTMPAKSIMLIKYFSVRWAHVFCTRRLCALWMQRCWWRVERQHGQTLSATGCLEENDNDVFAEGQYLSSVVIMETHPEHIYTPEEELWYTKTSLRVCFLIREGISNSASNRAAAKIGTKLGSVSPRCSASFPTSSFSPHGNGSIVYEK